MSFSPKDFILENGPLADFSPDQTVIIRKKFLPHIKTLKYVEEQIDWLKTNEWYPAVNSYYSYTEDVDAFARVNHLIEERTSTQSLNSHATPAELTFFTKLPQHDYLKRPPLTFLILGKPDLDQCKLGRRLANYWRCIYIDPLTLLEEEIESRRRTGECIEFNLRSGRAIGVDVIIRILPKKLESPEVKHRGAVVCGFPLIPNDLYEDDPISSESAVFTVKEIFEEMFEIVVSDQSAKVEVSLVSTPDRTEIDSRETNLTQEPMFEYSLSINTDVSVCGPKNVASDLEKQINLLFGVFNQPFLIIYLYSSNTDAILKRKNYLFHFYNNQVLDTQKLDHFAKVGMEIEELAREVLEDGVLSYKDSLRHLVRLPKDFPASVSTQLDHYHNVVATMIDSRIMLHPHEFFVKVDGRTYVNHMVNVLIVRLSYLLLSQKVILPKRFYRELEMHGETVAFQETEMTLDEALIKYTSEQVVAPRFKWSLSDWGYFCPVSMTRGIYKKGDPKFAARFMSHIYFLADEQAWFSFYSNPRAYLMPPFPKLGQRIMIFGPTHCGKTALAKSLHYLYGYHVLSFEDLEKDYMRTKMDEYKEITRQGAIAEALDLLRTKHEEEAEALQKQRLTDIANWEEECLLVLTEKSDLERSRASSRAMFLPSKMTDEELSGEGLLPMDMCELINRLVDLNLPASLNKDEINDILKNKSLLEPFLPDELKSNVVVQKLSVLDPFVLDYAKTKVDEVTLQTVSEVYGGNLLEMYTTVLRMTEISSEFMGWILDGMTLNLELVKEICEIFTIDEIVIMNDTPDFEFLKKQFRASQHYYDFTDFYELFVEMKEFDAAMQCQQESMEEVRVKFAHDIVDEIVNTAVGVDNDELTEQRFADYEEKLKVYVEQMKEIRNFFNETNKDIIELSVTNLSPSELIIYSVNKLRDRYRQLAYEYTQEDRASDVQIYLAENATGGGEGETQDTNPDNFVHDRNYGDYGEYCPVTFENSWVLWKGKEQYAIKFKNQIFLLATKENMQKCLEMPRNYINILKPPISIPPPRICVVGVPGSGKTTIAKALAKNLGVYYVSHKRLFAQVLSKLSRAAISVKNYESKTMWNFEQNIACLWTDEPYRSIGFVLDEYPQINEEFDYMIENVSIPDIIINCSVDRDSHITKRINAHFAEWKNERELERAQCNALYQENMENWQEERKARYNELMELKRQQRYVEKVKEALQSDDEAIEEVELPRTESQISYNSIDEQQDIDEVEQILNEELPEPVNRYIEESDEEGLTNISNECEKQYTECIEMLEKVKALAETELITWHDINSSIQEDKSVIQAIFPTNNIKFRNESFFAHCRRVPVETAEKLLDEGYYFLSCFGRICPVLHYYSVNILQMYGAGLEKGTLHAVIYRKHIYFLSSKKYCEEFISNPVKYLKTKTNFKYCPVRVAVIGPPKSGKICLSKRLSEIVSFQLISRGAAVNFHLKYFPYTSTAIEMEKVLRKGLELTDEMVLESVRILTYCYDFLAKGYIFDGFPSSINECRYLTKIGEMPHLIFNLQIKEWDCSIFSQNNERIAPKFLYSVRFIQHLYNEWYKTAKEYAEWLHTEYQNVYNLKVNKSCWGVCEEAKDVLLSVVYEMKHYYRNYDQDWPLSISNLLVTPLEFLERKSNYKAYCPVCLYSSRALTNGGDPPDRTGLVQFRDFFYWICQKHFYDFLKYPELYIPPLNVKLPEDLPKRVYLTEMPANIRENGHCVVCYSKHFPKMIHGLLEFAVEYIDNTYMFDSIECMQIFMQKPASYYGISTSLSQDLVMAPIDAASMPVLGYLETHIARQLVKAVSHVTFIRPVIPGLSISVAAMICIGLQFVIANPLMSQKHRDLYREALNRFYERKEGLIKHLEMMKQVLNPYVVHNEVETNDDVVEELLYQGTLSKESASGSHSSFFKEGGGSGDSYTYGFEG